MESLYDYLGKPAGAELGLKVATLAGVQKIKVETRIVNTKNYTGEINLYPTEFLDSIFKKIIK
jgi:hypothetical protein